MIEENNRLVRFAMQYGLILTAFFILKFVISVFSIQQPLFGLVGWIMIMCIPLILFAMLRYYREQYSFHKISYRQAWSLSMLLLFFASLPEALVQYGYFQFINPDYISDSLNTVISTLENMPELKDNNIANNLIDTYKQTDTPSAIQMAFQTIFNNLFFGGFLSFILAALVKKN